jgi:hypothetical protein
MSTYYAVPASVHVWADSEADALERTARFAHETQATSEGVSVSVSEDPGDAEVIEHADDEPQRA